MKKLVYILVQRGRERGNETLAIQNKKSANPGAGGGGGKGSGWQSKKAAEVVLLPKVV